MSAKRPTMRDVGERAGVSFKTVSRVVNGEGAVRPEVRARVQAAIDELGYRRDPAASTLRRADGRTGTIAVIVDDLANPFAATVHRAVVDTMRDHGVLVLSAGTYEDPEREQEAFRAFVDRRVDGLILMPTSADHAWLGDVRGPEIPVVMVDRPAVGFDTDVVLSDHRPAAARATTHLARRGHRRIALLTEGLDVHTARERLAGYEDALGAAGLAVDRTLVRSGIRTAEQAQDATIDLLSAATPPTAILGGYNRATIGAIRALRRLESQRSVALVGFDDVELADLLEPAVTVIAQDPVAIGCAAAVALLDRLDGDTEAPRPRVIPTRLVPRGSGEIGAPR
jgi:LacI family transcriptional regulator